MADIAQLKELLMQCLALCGEGEEAPEGQEAMPAEGQPSIQERFAQKVEEA